MPIRAEAYDLMPGIATSLLEKWRQWPHHHLFALRDEGHIFVCATVTASLLPTFFCCLAFSDRTLFRADKRRGVVVASDAAFFAQMRRLRRRDLLTRRCTSRSLRA